MSGPKIQFWIDSCASMKDLTSQISSVPTPVLTASTTSFRMDFFQSTPQGAAVLNYEQMDFSDISSDFPDIMTISSDDDVPDLDDISECLDNMQCKAWFA